jgi:V/A-type H+-transporting ATPase subunit K
MVSDVGLLAAAISVAGSGIAAAYAEATIGAAAVGAFAENDKNFSKGLIFTVIPETIAVFGLVVSLIILFVV